MTSLSDTLTVGLVLVLLFGSIALYLYTRIQQAEQKISLLESILLDMKMGMEIKSFTPLPAEEINHEPPSTEEHYAPFTEDDNSEQAQLIEEIPLKRGSPTPSVSSKLDEADDEVAQYKSVVAEAVKQDEGSSSTSSSNTSAMINYESMTLKELQTIAKSRGITGAGSMKKAPIIEALKTSDRSHTVTLVEPGLNSLNTTSGSFLETSSSFQASTEQTQ